MSRSGAPSSARNLRCGPATPDKNALKIMSPAGGFLDALFIDQGVPRIGVGLKNALVGLQVRLGVLALPVG